ncbi:restriction endonuclease PLD domain-containing protein [Desulfovirgula thermocuniculi]|uniref:restriction endonuclease PLD domain-containing protein n=1 Tax=Desulfovirgula thermocuniculi TaxID=348842 RepID=UPI0012EB0EFB|nr:restriction endonuclease PLD domain-containing protein [Desulfovirgula thermocuniculi]
MRDLYSELITRPYEAGMRELKVLTGYASSAFVHHVLYDLEELRLEVILGMAKAEPIAVWDHNEYVRLTRETGRLRVCYFLGDPPIHSKVLLWGTTARGGRIAFVGSANFSWHGFREYREVMAAVDPALAEAAFPQADELIECTDTAAFRHIKLSYQKGEMPGAIDASAVSASVRGCPSVNLPLVEIRTGRVHSRAGLNWGQRPGREPNQAYIPIPSTVHAEHPGFFPDRGIEFTVVTDDGESFICVVAQDNNKAIETSRDNSILGRYFRRRLGVPLGARVTDEALRRYGRSYVTFYKIDGGTYFMDFSPKGQKLQI